MSHKEISHLAFVILLLILITISGQIFVILLRNQAYGCWPAAEHFIYPSVTKVLF